MNCQPFLTTGTSRPMTPRKPNLVFDSSDSLVSCQMSWRSVLHEWEHYYLLAILIQHPYGTPPQEFACQTPAASNHTKVCHQAYQVQGSTLTKDTWPVLPPTFPQLQVARTSSTAVLFHLPGQVLCGLAMWEYSSRLLLYPFQ